MSIFLAAQLFELDNQSTVIIGVPNYAIAMLLRDWTHLIEVQVDEHTTE